jgi:hypothetical protein
MDITTIAITIAIQLIVLHRADGGAVTVIPSHITSLHAKALGPDRDKLTTREARCIIWLADGRLLSVLETCDQVKAMLEGAAPDRLR